MNTKDDILNPLVIHYHLTTRVKQRWSDAMDEYAKEIAIGFAKWCMDNTAQDLNTDNKWYYEPKDGHVNYEEMTDEQLFKSYLNTLQQ